MRNRTAIQKTVVRNGTVFSQRFWTSGAPKPRVPQMKPTLNGNGNMTTSPPAPYPLHAADSLVENIQQNLTPDLLKSRYRNQTPSQHPHTGHCYVATEVLYHLWGKHHGAKPMRMKVGDDVHWWLQHPTLGVIDPTAAQFPFPVEYEKGRGGGFLTREPSARARVLMGRVQSGE